MVASFQTVMLSAAENGHPEVLKNWIKEQINSNTNDKLGRTALFIASLNGHLATVEYLLKIGANPNQPNQDGITPLHCVANTEDNDEEKRVCLAQILLAYGAQINARDNTSTTNGGNGNTPLHNVAYAGSAKFAQYLIDQGAGIEIKDQDGMTALHIASKIGNLQVVKVLVEKGGAQIDARNNKGETAFVLANGNNRQEVAKYLLEKKREARFQIPQENFSNKDACIICLEPRNDLYVLIPCGHMSLCELCSYNLTQQTNPKCPSCRKPVRDYTKVFYQAPDPPPSNQPKISTNILRDGARNFDKQKWEKLKSEVMKMFTDLKKKSSDGHLTSTYIKHMKFGLNQMLKEFNEFNLEGQDEKIKRKREGCLDTIKNYISNLEAKEQSMRKEKMPLVKRQNEEIMPMPSQPKRRHIVEEENYSITSRGNANLNIAKKMTVI